MRQFTCDYEIFIKTTEETVVSKKFTAEVIIHPKGFYSGPVTEVRTVSVIDGLYYIVDKHVWNRAYLVKPKTKIKYLTKVSE